MDGRYESFGLMSLNYQSDATNGQAAVPELNSNSDDTTYTTQDMALHQESSITDNDKEVFK